MEVSRTSDSLTVSGLPSGSVEDDFEGRSPASNSPSLAPFLARLCRDERLGWSTSRTRADDTDSLSVNVSDCGSCHLSEVSSVSSWLNDASAVDDDCSSCAAEDDSGSEKEYIDEDDDNGHEIRPLYLLQRCLEEKLLEQQQNNLMHLEFPDCDVSRETDDTSSPHDDTADVETNTIKRASRNLCTLKTFEIPDLCEPVDNLDTSGAVMSTFSPPSMPLCRSGSRCNPDSLICTGAIYDFNLSTENADVQNGGGHEMVENEQNDDQKVSVGQHHRVQKCHGVSHSAVNFPMTISPDKPVQRLNNVIFPSKDDFTDQSSLASKTHHRDVEKDKPLVESSLGARQTHIPNGSAYGNQIAAKHVLPGHERADMNCLSTESVQINGSTYHSSSATTTHCASPPASKLNPRGTSEAGVTNDQSLTVVPVAETKLETAVEATEENLDATSVVSDEAEKASDRTGSVAMPMVEDGLSNSDISDVDEAFSLFAGLKPPDPVPVDTSCGCKSPSTSDTNSRTLRDVDVNSPEAHSICSLGSRPDGLRTSIDDYSSPSKVDSRSSVVSGTLVCKSPDGAASECRVRKSESVDSVAGSHKSDTEATRPKTLPSVEKTDETATRPSPSNGSVPTGVKAQPVYEGERESFLIEGVLFRARYLGSTQLISEGQPSKAVRMLQAQEAIGRIKQKASEQNAAAGGSSQPSTLVDLFVSVEKIMVLNTDLQEIMMDHALRTISYIADIGDLLVVMARRGPVATSPGTSAAAAINQTKICCHIFESDEAQLIAQSISQAFQVAYMEFLKANGINDPSLMKEMDYQDVLSQQAIFGEELFLFSNKDMQKEIIIPKLKNEALGVVIVESGWGSMVPTIVLASMAPGGAAARCSQLNVGDQIMSVNGISLVGLPLSTCQNYVKAVRSEILVRLLVVSCTPVVEVLVKRPDIKYQLGFSVQNGVICSLLRGGIAERGGVRVGHRIIEINGQSVVAVPHEKIVGMLATAVGEIHMKTMQTSVYRLLTGQDTPHYI